MTNRIRLDFLVSQINGTYSLNVDGTPYVNDHVSLGKMVVETIPALPVGIAHQLALYTGYPMWGGPETQAQPLGRC